MSETTLPEPQDIVVPSGSAMRASFKRRERLSRGKQHTIEDASAAVLTGGVGSGLQAMLTPTAATHAGGTILTHIGTSMVGPRIVIPMPAALATVAAMVSGTGPASAPAVAGAAPEPLPSMAVDTEWFSIEAYPVELRQYLVGSFTFDLRPRSPSDVVELTAEMLRQAYRTLSKLGMGLKMAPGLVKIFKTVSADRNDKDKGPLHPYNESEATRTLYLMMAYVVSTLLWAADGPGALRKYPEPTYPGVIIASFVVRMAAYYRDVSAVLGLTTPYLRAGGRRHLTDTTTLLHLRETAPVNQLARTTGIINIPAATLSLLTVLNYASGRVTQIDPCPGNVYSALQDGALNVKGVTDAVATQSIMLKIPPNTNPLQQQIVNARCAYYVGLLRKTINPGDESAAAGIAGGEQGIEDLSVPPDT